MLRRESLRRAGLVLALAAAAAGPAAAQTPDEPNLILTISAGYLTGGDLWSLPRQFVLAATTPSHTWDSVALGRRLRPGLAATLTATMFFSPHLGYTAEAGFFGIGTTSRCVPLGPYTQTTDMANQQACLLINGENARSDVVGFLGGLTYRFTTGGVQPYLRASGGLAILGSSFVEEAEVVQTSGNGASLVYFLADQNHKTLTWMLSLGAGAMLPLAPGYQLRFEARDIIVPLPYPTGPAADTAAIAGELAQPQPPVGLRTMHLPTFTVGLEVVLERKRGHRY